MANSPAPALVLHEDDEPILREWVRASTIKAGLARRARIVLLAADGLPNTSIAELTGSSVVTVLKWRTRYTEAGIAGLGDDPRSGRPKQLDHFDIVTTTLVPPPKKYGVTHWSSRLLGKHLKVGHATVARAWREYGVQPWKAETFKFSTVPELEAKVTDVIGLYLAPPENAVVLSVDEKSQIQALDRAAPLLPMRMGDAEKRTHDYHRHGTSTLFAALEVATGQVTGAVKPRHRRQEFLSFLRQINRAYPDQELHLIMDNYATHKTAEVRDWLEAHPRFHVHFTPTSGSWLNLVEVWFGIIDRQAIKRGVFTSVKNLNKKIREFITGWNKRKHPFVWTKTPEQVLEKAKPKTTSETQTGIKGLGSRLRQLTGSDEDDYKLVEDTMGGNSPQLRLGPLQTRTQRDEQRGVANLTKGLFSAFRNPAAHEPRIEWTLTEADALDVLGTISMIHRRLDVATVDSC